MYCMVDGGTARVTPPSVETGTRRKIQTLYRNIMDRVRASRRILFIYAKKKFCDKILIPGLYFEIAISKNRLFYLPCKVKI